MIFRLRLRKMILKNSWHYKIKTGRKNDQKTINFVQKVDWKKPTVRDF
jgi:hypothetical protein